MIEKELCIVELKNDLSLSFQTKDFIYVERRYNAEANELLTRLTKKKFLSFHPTNKFGTYRLYYFPTMAQDLLRNRKVMAYTNPSHKQLEMDHLYDIVFDKVISNPYVMVSGFIHFTGHSNNGCNYYSYTPYNQREAENLEQMFLEIAERDKQWYIDHTDQERLAVGPKDDGIRFSIGKGGDVMFREDFDYKPKPADDTFDTESKQLIKEIKERIGKLEQKGIERAILMKLIGEEPKISRMIIDSKYRIYLIDYDYMEIKMTPLVKAVFLLFLNHPEGILFKELGNYKAELTRIYTKISNRSDVGDMKKSIDDICNPLNNSINEKCARIREAFVANFDSVIAENYYVTGKKGEAKGIRLDRNMVIMGN